MSSDTTTDANPETIFPRANYPLPIPPEPPTNLIFDDGVPLESNRHRIAMNALIDSVMVALSDRPNFFAGGNMFVYYSRNQRMNEDFRGPDFFVVLDVEQRERQGWVVWEEGGRYPDVIVEFLSPSTARIDKVDKKDLYERVFHTADYFVYDPFDRNSLEGWHLNGSQHYQPLMPNDRGWLWCDSLKLWLGTWEGVIQQEPGIGTCHWLRFYTEAGEPVPLSAEFAQQQAETERQRAEQERQRAQVAQQQAEQERQRAEQEQQRAQVAQQQAEQERQRAEQERQRAERLAARLRELGLNPEEVE
ncbi:MAG: Uma2 family endonuclease [Leptolyngbyaceae cyanobacterium bins.349]|nr:Uma2 family endonuclease [Leptolyngbyaceae cyanobacterium bins.349]